MHLNLKKGLDRHNCTRETGEQQEVLKIALGYICTGTVLVLIYCTWFAILLSYANAPPAQFSFK